MPDVTVELLLDGVWTDVSADVRQADGVQITRGRSAEASQAEPSSCSLTLNNRLGKYSPRNPTGAYYGVIGRNTQIRVSLPNMARFYGEVSAWPQRWDKTGNDAWTPIQAVGVLRRLGQGSTALRSTLYRALSNQDDVVAYWPCEDAEGSTQFASALSGYPPMNQYYGTAQAASFDGFAASEPLPLASNVTWNGGIPAYSVTGETQANFLMAVPAGGVSAESAVCYLRTTGTAQLWTVHVNTSGALRLQAFNSTGVQIADSGFSAFNVNGKLLRVSVELDSTTADVDWALATLEVGQSSGLATSGTLLSRTIGRIRWVAMNPRVGATPLLDDVALGHVSVHNAITSIYSLNSQLKAYDGEHAASRMQRLCSEEGVPFTVFAASGVTETARMGPQTPATLLDLLGEAADADMGVLFDKRDSFGLAYRTRASMYAQAATLTLDYAARTVSSIEPVEDDDAIQNDVTVTRVNGSSARAQLETGPLSVNAPPDGVGRYSEDVSLSLFRDTDLPDQAGWRLHLGTVDEARYPVLGANLAGLAFQRTTALVLNGTSPGRASTPDTAALDITGDIDVRVYLAMDDWTPTSTQGLVSKYDITTPQRSFRFVVNASGTLRLVWSTDGSNSIVADSTVAPTVVDGAALWVRVTLDVNNGAAGRDIKFYTSTDGIAWTQLGATVTQGTVTSIFSSTAPVAVGAGFSNGAVWSEPLAGKVSAVEIRSSIGGTIVAAPDFGAQPAGTTSFDDFTGKTWTVTSPATIGTVSPNLFSTVSDLTADAADLDVGDRLVVTGAPDAMTSPDDIQQIAQGFTETITPFEWLIDVNCTPASPWDVGRWDDSEGPGEARYSSDGTTLAAGAALLLDGASPGRASTPDTAALDITGDIDLRAHAALDDWTPSTSQALITKWTGASQRSYIFQVTTAGTLRLFWSTTGADSASATSTAAPTVSDGEPLWVRVTMDVNDGGGTVKTIRFYTSTDGVTWTQLGSTVQTAGTTSIFASTTEVAVGATMLGTTDRLAGRVFSAEVRSGIDGTIVANPDFGAQAAGATSFADSTGKTWTVTSPAVLDDDAISVLTPTGPVWGTTDLPYDLGVGGERMTVTAVTGTGPLQVLTVTRAVNGVVKAQATGTDVQLFKPAVYAL